MASFYQPQWRLRTPDFWNTRQAPGLVMNPLIASGKAARAEAVSKLGPISH